MELFFIEEQIPEVNTDIFLESMSMEDFFHALGDGIKKIIISMQDVLSKLKNMIADTAFRSKMKYRARMIDLTVKDGKTVMLPNFDRIFDLYQNQCHELPKKLGKLQKKAKKIRSDAELSEFENQCLDFEDELNACMDELDDIAKDKIPVTKTSKHMDTIKQLAGGRCRAFNLYADAIDALNKMSTDYYTTIKRADVEAHRTVSDQNKRAMSVHVGLVRKLSSCLNRNLKRCVFIVTSL